MGGSCGCKCSNCCAICDNGCWGACCVCPTTPTTCGCGEPLVTGETCLNSTYYYYGNQTSGAYTGNVYYALDFQYVIFVPEGGSTLSVSETIQYYMSYYFSNCGIGNISPYTFNETKPDSSYVLAESISANNCFMYACDITAGLYAPFEPYYISGCDYGWPPETGPTC
jgi:hypothetical protein